MYTITKQFTFCASHQLLQLAERNPNHPCARLHGHNYVVELELRAPALNDVGFVRDFGDLALIRHWIDRVLDHQHLNVALNTPDGSGTTAEALARTIFHQWDDVFPELSAVRVSETPKTWAEYRPARPA
jgi:6-pyruvoyltetrahydropterin/6-carboxytetrahydropterin synthase